MIFLCRADDLAATGAKSVVLGEGLEQLDIVVVLNDGKHYAYINSCPHQFIPLDIFPDQFFSDDGKHLMCCGHGALFEPNTGLCIEGPCENETLDALSIEEKNGEIFLKDARPPEAIAREHRNKRNW